MELLKPGQIFAERYRIERFLAQGGMGAVFLAEQLATELTVAVKVLFPRVLSSNTAIERFQLEARVAARVKSQHIVAVLDAGFDPATRLPFLVMEYLRGKPLSDVVAAKGALSPDDVVSYIAQCASGLDKAHCYTDKQGNLLPIVHRDLKPENLYLTQMEDGSPLIKILDFGIAKVLSNTMNLSQELTGTPLFMAFEQAGGRPVTPQTDIWALGLISFYLLTRRYYWRNANIEGAELTALLGEILVDPIVAPSSRAHDLAFHLPAGSAYDTWFLRCVNREPSERYRTAGEAALALGAALGVAPPFVDLLEPARDRTTLRAATTPSIQGDCRTFIDDPPQSSEESISLSPYVKWGHGSTSVRAGAAILGMLVALGVLSLAFTRWRAADATVPSAGDLSSSVGRTPPVGASFAVSGSTTAGRMQAQRAAARRVPAVDAAIPAVSINPTPPVAAEAPAVSAVPALRAVQSAGPLTRSGASVNRKASPSVDKPVSPVVPSSPATIVPVAKPVDVFGER